jgi:hypothetical protein
VKPSKSQEEAEKAGFVKHKVRKDAERLVCDRVGEGRWVDGWMGGWTRPGYNWRVGGLDFQGTSDQGGQSEL